MVCYQTKLSKLKGSSDKEIYNKSKRFFNRVGKQTKRKPYIRSAYFKKQKIFLDFFWEHLNQRSNKQRVMRLRYLECAFELMAKSRNKPSVKTNPNKKSENLYRFAGITREKELFYVQIKEDTKNRKLYFMSVFPVGED